MAMRIDVLTTFSEMFACDAPAALGVSIPARARAAGLVEWHATDVRAYSTDKHRKTDERPFGGGPGMVMMCQPLWDAVQAVEAADARPARRVLLTPQGVPLTQPLVEELARCDRLVLIAGHYEGIDERVIERLAPLEVSLGDYVISGGELAAMVLMDAVIRLIPGALGDEGSNVSDSFSAFDVPRSVRQAVEAAHAADEPTGGEQDTGGEGETSAARGSESSVDGPGVSTDGSRRRRAKKDTTIERRRLLDCPHYTKPREWMGAAVPEVLLSGDHARIARWRLEKMLERTRERRPELLGGVEDDVRRAETGE
jgi:tRNA (guanine37-N1)-methyltransferase